MVQPNATLTRLLIVVSALVGLTFPLSSAARADEAKKAEVQIVRDIPYYEGADADKVKHKLDLFLPKGQKEFPVVLFVHGGAWLHGDKSFLGIYSAVGMFFARHGIGAVVTNYRLSPAVQHPEHVKDVARAFAWTCKNIDKYGGRTDQIFLCGHSAGAHLVSLLATDETYLKAVGLTPKAIKGVIPISGVYAIPDRLLPMVFGTDPETRKKAGPIEHVRADEPPFLILYAQSDLQSIDKMSEAFYKCLKDNNCRAQLLEVKKRNHMTILMNAVVENDPAAVAILDFITGLLGKTAAVGQ